MLSKVLFGITLATSIAVGILFTSNMRLQENLTEVNAAFALQKSTISEIKSSFTKSVKENSELQNRLRVSEAESAELRSVLSDHNLTNLAERKPALIEGRINNATKELFDSIERITSE
jgi:hypothetical protein